MIDKAENIHFRKNLGIAELQKDKVLEFCKRHYPDQLEEFKKDLEKDDGEYIIDFENLFTGLEKVPIYTSVLDCIKTGIIIDDQQKAWMSTFLTHHVLRSPRYLEALIEHNRKEGIEKFETLITLKWSLSGKVFLTPEIMSVYSKQWTLYKLDNMLLPLSDFPIIGTPSCLFAPLSPNFLLMVTPKPAQGLGINYESRIPSNLYNQFLRATIQKTDMGLIFAEEKYLLKCKKTKWWHKRRQSLGLP